MIHNKSLVHLEDICNNSKLVLVDASVLFGSLDIHNIKGRNRLINRINYKRFSDDSCILFSKYFKTKPNFYITAGILEECIDDEDLNLRDCLGKYQDFKVSKKEKEYFSKICSNKQERTQLVKAIKKNKKIVRLNLVEAFTYSELSRASRDLKEKYRLSDNDYELLIKSCVLQEKKGKTSVLTNDFGLINAYLDLINRFDLDSKRYSFYTRNKFNFFQRHTSKIRN